MEAKIRNIVKRNKHLFLNEELYKLCCNSGVNEEKFKEISESFDEILLKNPLIYAYCFGFSLNPEKENDKTEDVNWNSTLSLEDFKQFIEEYFSEDDFFGIINYLTPEEERIRFLKEGQIYLEEAITLMVKLGFLDGHYEI